MKVLGIESSCDETAAAVVEDGRKIISNIVRTQISTHELYGGVVPEIASRAHLEAISSVTRLALEPIGGIENIDAISVTNAPGLIGALLVGVGFAKGLSFSSCKPLVPVHHIRGHVAAAYLTHYDLTPPFIALIVSGGHSHLVYVSDYTSYKILGGTRDDAAGESFDKAARVLGLGYPGGPKMDALAKLGDPDSIYFPRVHFHDAPFDFSFSGVKTSIINYVHNAEQTGKELNKPDVAASFSRAICEILTEKAVLAVNSFDLPQKKLVVAGGVAANSMLRKMISEEADKNGITLYIPDIPLCGDNGAMIASQGYYEYCSGNIASSDLNAFATESIEL